MDSVGLLRTAATDVESATDGEALNAQGRGGLRRVACLGSALVGLLVVALVMGSSGKHLHSFVSPSSFEQKSEAEAPTVCYADGPGGDLIKYSMSAVPDGVCASYTFMGKLAHVPVSKSTCDTMKTMPATYEDLTCCTKDLCNNATSPAKEPDVESPSVCYADGPGGDLIKYSMSAVPDGACASYTYMGKVVHVPVSKITCDTMKTMPATYVDLTCCTTDLCNNATTPAKESDVESPSVCYADGPGGALIKYSMTAVPDGACASYTFMGKVAHVPVSKSTCDTMKTMPATYEDLTCCTTDLCNGD